MEIVYKLMPLTRQQLYAETSKIAWILLFLFFLLSLVFVYIRTPQGSSDFLDVLKRLVIVMLLLTSFPQITHWIQAISSGVTETISQVSTYGAFFELLKEGLNAIIITAPTKIRTITQAARAVANSPMIATTKTLLDNWHQKQFMNRAVRKVIRPPNPPSK